MIRFQPNARLDAAQARDRAEPAPMGRVLPFAPDAARPRRERPVCEPRGEIVLFLGVRYERRAS